MFTSPGSRAGRKATGASGLFQQKITVDSNVVINTTSIGLSNTIISANGQTLLLNPLSSNAIVTVGSCTSTTDIALQVWSNTGGAYTELWSNGSYKALLGYYANGHLDWTVGSWSSGSDTLVFCVNNSTEYMRITPTGNIGIQTTNPHYALDVANNIHANNEIIGEGLTGPGQAGQFRAVDGNYGLIMRNDGASFWLLPTASGNQFGTWAITPFSLTLSNGLVTMNNGGDINGGATVTGGLTADVITVSAANAGIIINDANTGQQASLWYKSNNVSKWQVLKDIDDSYALWDITASKSTIRAWGSGNLSFTPASGLTFINSAALVNGAVNCNALNVFGLGQINGLILNLTSFNLGGSNLAVYNTGGANSGDTLVGWNRSNGDGELSFISNRQAGGSGGVSFWDWPNTQVNAASLYFRVWANGGILANGSLFLSNTSAGIQANGTFGTSGQILTTSGSAVYWSNTLQVNTITMNSIDATGVDKGTVSSGTVTFNLQSAAVQRLQVGGALTVAFSGWPTSGTYQEGVIYLVNGGSATITWPSSGFFWVYGDGTHSATFDPSVTLYSANINTVMVWSWDGGANVFAKAV